MKHENKAQGGAGKGLFDKWFKLSDNKTTVKTEVMAGITTFMTMAYILAVNPNILSAAGIPRGGVFVATAIASVVGTMLMAFMANYPFVLAPGMGMNAFLAFSVVLGMGYSWQFALLAIFIEGIVFLLLSLTPVREGIFNCIPMSLKKAVAAGIGLFICFIALQSSKLVVDSPATLVECVNFRNVPFHTHGICATLAVVGTLLTAVLMAKNFKGSILLGIILTWVLGMIAQAFGVYVPDPANGYFSLYPNLTFEGLSESFGEFGDTLGAIFAPGTWTRTIDGQVSGSGWSLLNSLDFFVLMFAFFFMDLFNTLGTLIGVAMKGDFLDKEGRLPRVSGALCADAIATSVGAALGTSTTTTYVESAAGVATGGEDRAYGVFLRHAVPACASLCADIPCSSRLRHRARANRRRLPDGYIHRGHKMGQSRRGHTGLHHDGVDAVYIFGVGRHTVRRDLLHLNQRDGRKVQANPLDNVCPYRDLHCEVCTDVAWKG